MEASAKSTLRALIAIVFFTYIGQNLLNTSLAPVGRAMHLPAWVLGATVSLAAVMVASLSQKWGRLSLSWGRRPVLVTALALACAAGYLFAATAWAASSGYLAPNLAAIGILLARGCFFGAAVAAVPPTGQALIAALTPTTKERVRGMALFGSSFNAAIMIGSLLSAVLAGIALMLPVYTTPIMVTIALFIALFAIPKTNAEQEKVKAPHISPFDRRVLPFLVAGFGLFFAFGTNQILLGFLVQDRYQYPANVVVSYTGLLLLVQALCGLTFQALIVPRLNLRPLTLMRTGLTFMAIGIFLVALPLDHIWVLFVAVAFIGSATGIFGPGYNAGASLAVSAAEQGGVAGLLNANSATTWIIAPVLGTLLYGFNALLPFIVAGAVLALSVLVAWMPRKLRRRLAKLQ